MFSNKGAAAPAKIGRLLNNGNIDVKTGILAFLLETVRTEDICMFRGRTVNNHTIVLRNSRNAPLLLKIMDIYDWRNQN